MIKKVQLKYGVEADVCEKGVTYPNGQFIAKECCSEEFQKEHFSKPKPKAPKKEKPSEPEDK